MSLHKFKYQVKPMSDDIRIAIKKRVIKTRKKELLLAKQKLQKISPMEVDTNANTTTNVTESTIADNNITTDTTQKEQPSSSTTTTTAAKNNNNIPISNSTLTSPTKSETNSNLHITTQKEQQDDSNILTEQQILEKLDQLRANKRKIFGFIASRG